MNKKIYYAILLILLLVSAYKLWHFSFDHYWSSLWVPIVLVVWLWSRNDLIEMFRWLTDKEKGRLKVIRVSRQLDFKTQCASYMELCRLCCRDENMATMLPFLACLREGTDEEGLDTLHQIVKFSENNECSFIATFDWKQKASDFASSLREILNNNYYGRAADLPNYDDDVFVADVLKDLGRSLQERGLQLAFIDTQFDEYVFIVNRLEDRVEASRLVGNVGYDYLVP